MQGLTYKNYNYKNTTLNGELRKGFFSGLVQVNDPNLHLSFNGEVDLVSNIHKYKFDATLFNANLVAMHLVGDTSLPSILSTHIKVDAQGNTFDDLTGTLSVDSAHYFRRQQYHLNYLTFTSQIDNGMHIVTLTSDYADVTVTGHYSPINSYKCFQGLLSNYIPDRFPKELHGKKDFHDYAFDIHLKGNTGLTDLFVPSLKIAQGTDLRGGYQEKNDMFFLSGQSSEIDWGGRKAKNWEIDAKGNGSDLKTKFTCDTLFVSDSLYAAGFSLNGEVNKDTVHYAINWINDTSNFAEIPGYIAFTKGAQTVFRLLQPKISLADSIWQLNKENQLVIDSNGVTAQDIMFFHGQQYISIMGRLSNKPNDALEVDFHKFNIEDLIVTPSSIIKGIVEGTASIKYANRKLLFVSALNFKDIYFNKQYLGDGAVNSYWDAANHSIATNGEIVYNGEKTLSFIGNYFPNKDSENVNIDAIVHGFQLKTFNVFTKGYTSDMDGTLSGNCRMSGRFDKPIFNGNFVANIKKIKVDYLNTYYHSSEVEVAVLPDTFRIIPSHLFDEKGDTAIISGDLTHKQFKDLKLNFSLTTNNFFCLHTKDDNNSSYFGDGFVAGDAKFYGYLNSIHIDADITTQKGTTFNIPLSNASEVEQSDFIRFTSKKTPESKKKKSYKVNLDGITLDFNIHVTPDATAKLIFASKVGDELTGRGNGNIQFGMNNTGDISMRGDYTVTDGSYRFVLQNVINEDFNLVPGGTIEWSGDPYNAEINISTQHVVRTSLHTLLPSDTTHGYTQSIPVYCDLGLSGKLQSPDIKFDIELPTADEETQQTVASYLANPDEMNRQVFALLIIKSFLPVQEGANTASAPTAQTIIPGTAATAILSSQLTNLLNSISNKVNVGVNINPATTLSPQEVQLLLSTELLGGRVLINTDMAQIGTTTTGQATENSNNLVGEVTVEYLLSKDGKVRVKAFNKANDNTTIYLLNAPYTQGAGVSYRESFNTFGELWDKVFKKSNKEAKKEEAPTPKDSLKTDTIR